MCIGGQKDFCQSIGEDHTGHIAPIRDQAGRLRKVALALQQRLAQSPDRRDFRGHIAGRFLPNGLAHVLAIQQNGFVQKARIQGTRPFGQLLLMRDIQLGFRRPTRAQGLQGDQTVQGTTVQIVKAQLARHGLSHGAFARCRRPVDGDHRNHRWRIHLSPF